MKKFITRDEAIQRAETATKDRNELYAVEQTLSKLPSLLRKDYEEMMHGKGLAAAKRQLAEDAISKEK